MKRIIVFLLVIMLCLCLSSLLFACGDNKQDSSKSLNVDVNIYSLYEDYVSATKAKGVSPKTYKEWLNDNFSNNSNNDNDLNNSAQERKVFMSGSIYDGNVLYTIFDDLSCDVKVGVSSFDSKVLSAIPLWQQMKSYNIESDYAISIDCSFNSTALEKVVFSDKVCHIEKYAFKGCNSLKSLTLPFACDDELGVIFMVGWYRDIDSNYYYGAGDPNNQNEKYIVPKSLKEITIVGDNALPDYAFRGFQLRNLYIKTKSITSIGKDAFGSLYNIIFIGTIEEWNSINKDPLYKEDWQKIYCADGEVYDENN